MEAHTSVLIVMGPMISEVGSTVALGHRFFPFALKVTPVVATYYQQVRAGEEDEGPLAHVCLRLCEFHMHSSRCFFLAQSISMVTFCTGPG